MVLSTEQYRVWCPDMGETEDDCHLFNAYDHEEAAKKYTEKSYRDEPFEQSMDVFVRCTFGGDEGELKAYSVTPEPTVYFSAYENNP